MATSLYYFAVEILFYLFHFSVLILLIAKKKTTFKGPFFTILRYVIAVELLNFLCMCDLQYISNMPAFIEFHNTNTYFGSILSNLVSYVNVVTYIGHLLMACNRFTLIWFPLKYHKIWERQWYTCVLLFLPFLHVCWRLHEPAAFIQITKTTVKLSHFNADVDVYQSIWSTTIYFSSTFLTGIFNVTLFLRFYFSKTKINVNEKSLLLVSSITFIAQLLKMTYNAHSIVFPNNFQLTAVFLELIPYLNDIFALSGSISLLILSSITRKQYYSFYFCQKISENEITTCQVKTFSLQSSKQISKICISSPIIAISSAPLSYKK